MPVIHRKYNMETLLAAGRGYTSRVEGVRWEGRGNTINKIHDSILIANDTEFYKCFSVKYCLGGCEYCFTI